MEKNQQKKLRNDKKAEEKRLEAEKKKQEKIAEEKAKQELNIKIKQRAKQSLINLSQNEYRLRLAKNTKKVISKNQVQNFVNKVQTTKNERNAYKEGEKNKMTRKKNSYKR